MEVQRNSARYLEGRQLADAYMRGHTNATVQGTVRKRSAELRTSQEQVDLTQGYNDRIREISNLSMDEIGKLMGLYKS